MSYLPRLLVVSLLCLLTPQLSSAQTSGPPAKDSPPVVLVTGANRGIGLALATAYGREGWRVIATCRDPDRAKDLLKLSKTHPNVVIEQLDVTDAKSVDALVARHAAEPIDVLINNAGTSGNYQGQLPGTFDDAAFQEIMRVNAFAPMRLSTALLENIRAGRQKKIIAITSGRGSVSKPFLEQRAYFYDMSKAALNLGMRKLQAGVQDKGVLIGIFAPGIVDTDLNENLRNGVPAQRKFISTQESAAGLVSLIANLSTANQDAFMNYNGDQFTW
jgi:NAD(P)-dependent dehydrogenase (short-subunit alcohol dehydrogenase family)